MAPAFTLTGTFRQLTGTDTGYVSVTLTGFSPQIPRTADGVLADVFYQSPVGTSFSVTLYGNDQILPPSTYYNISVFDAAGKPVIQKVPYLLTGSGGDLASLTPMTSAPLPIPTPSTVLANTFLGGPASGGAAPPAYRAIVDADLEVSSSAIIGNLPSTPQIVKGVLSLTSQQLSSDGVHGVIVYADQMSGADNSAKIQAAITALPTVGGTVDARALPNENSGTGGSTTIDPGTKAVTLLLGPVTYQFPQVVLETSFRIFGSGAGDQGSAQGPTVIQAANNTSDLFVITQTNQAVQGVHLKDFRIYTKSSGSGASQRGFYVQAQNGLGLWYSRFDNLMIGAAGPGLDHFHGGNLVFDATINTGFVQFNDFTNVMSWRSANSISGHSLDLWGGCAQNVFRNCQFDGPSYNDGGTNVFIGDHTNNGQDAFPNTALFLDCTCQYASKGWVVAGSWSLTWIGSHIESIGQVWTFQAGAINANLSATIQSSYIVTSGQQSGAGYILTDTNSAGADSVNFAYNLIQQGADANVTGTTANINQFGNVGGSGGSVPFSNYLRGPLQASGGFSQTSTATINTSTFTNIGTTTAAGLFIVRDADHGGSALVLISDVSSISVIASIGGTTTFVGSASPSTNQIGLQASSTQLQAKAGSGSGTHVTFTQISGS